MKPNILFAALLSSILWTIPVTASQFVPLGDFPEGSFVSDAYAISGNGLTVVGAGCRGDFGTASPPPTTDAFRWTASSGLNALTGPNAAPATYTLANGISQDGSVVVGHWSEGPSNSPGETQAFRWTAADGYLGLGYLPGGQTSNSDAIDTSADGTIIVGYGATSDGFAAFRWTAQDGITALSGAPSGTFVSVANGISADGNYVTGTFVTDSIQQAFRWDAVQGMVPLGSLPGGISTTTQANGISADGHVVVGDGYSANSKGALEAFRWSDSGGMQGLGDLPGGEFISLALAASGDGSVVVGYSEAHDPALGQESGRSNQAFVWDQLHGMRDLQQLLIDQYGLSSALAGWQLFTANSISDDGLSIAGNGFNPQGNFEAWLVRLDHPLTAPEPSSIVLALLAAAPIFLLTRRNTASAN
jgi:probable HAF family extracellular repeat protein